MPTTADQLRAVMRKFATGVTVVLARWDGEVCGMTANAVTSVSLEPPMVLLCVGRDRYFHGVLEHTAAYTMNILREDQELVARYFAGDRQERFEPYIRLAGRSGVPHPVLEEAVGWLDCRVVDTCPGGDHTVFLARVERTGWSDSEPLLFYEGRYGRVQLR